MPSSTNIPADVREAIGAFMDHAQDNNHTLALTEALKAIRRTFPDLEASDNALADAFTSEAVASSVRLHLDMPLTEIQLDGRPTLNHTPSLDRWDNEGGAPESPQTADERRDSQRRAANDTDGKRRRARETRQRNRLI